MTDAGRSLPEIKNVTGHLSDKVVQGYIANSVVQKRKASSDLATANPPPALRSTASGVTTGTPSSVTPGVTVIVNYPGIAPV